MLSRRTSVGAWVLVGLVAVALGAAAGACGQSVATCASVCPAPSGDADTCTPACTSLQSACASAGDGADFQAYLTCVANSGGFANGTSLDPNGPTSSTETTTCAAELALVQSECASPVPPFMSPGTGTGTSQGSSPGSGTGSSGGCAGLAACCVMLPASSVAACEAVVTAGNGFTCSEELTSIQEQGYCDTTVMVFDAGEPGDDTQGDDSGITTTACALGAVCDTPGSSCTLAGAGPCSSDAVLDCAPSGLYALVVFTCTDQVPGCGWASGSCSENCSCTNDQMVCTGNCPDGGLSSP